MLALIIDQIVTVIFLMRYILCRIDICSGALTHSVKALDISLKIDMELALQVGRRTKRAWLFCITISCCINQLVHSSEVNPQFVWNKGRESKNHYGILY